MCDSSDPIDNIETNIKPKKKSDAKLVRILQVMMISGLLLILLGIYFHMYSETIDAMGVTGMVISACCVAIGMIMSLPTKMYLTFVLVKREDDLKIAKRKKEALRKVETSKVIRQEITKPNTNASQSDL